MSKQPKKSGLSAIGKKNSVPRSRRPLNDDDEECLDEDEQLLDDSEPPFVCPPASPENGNAADKNSSSSQEQPQTKNTDANTSSDRLPDRSSNPQVKSKAAQKIYDDDENDDVENDDDENDDNVCSGAGHSAGKRKKTNKDAPKKQTKRPRTNETDETSKTKTTTDRPTDQLTDQPIDRPPAKSDRSRNKRKASDENDPPAKRNLRKRVQGKFSK